MGWGEDLGWRRYTYCFCEVGLMGLTFGMVWTWDCNVGEVMQCFYICSA